MRLYRRDLIDFFWERKLTRYPLCFRPLDFGLCFTDIFDYQNMIWNRYTVEQLSKINSIPLNFWREKLEQPALYDDYDTIDNVLRGRHSTDESLADDLENFCPDTKFPAYRLDLKSLFSTRGDKIISQWGRWRTGKICLIIMKLVWKLLVVFTCWMIFPQG